MDSSGKIPLDLDPNRPPPLSHVDGSRTVVLRLFRISQAACESLDTPQLHIAMQDDLLR